MRGSPGRSVQLRWLPPLGFVIPLFAGALLVGPMSGQAAPEDRALARWIEEQTRQDETLAGTRVIVHARQGAVVLSGMVRLYSQKIRYEQIAWHSPGVREVENEIRVIPAGSACEGEGGRRNATKDAYRAGFGADDARCARHGGGPCAGKSGSGNQIKSVAGPAFCVPAGLGPGGQLTAVARRWGVRTRALHTGRARSPEHCCQAPDPE